MTGPSLTFGPPLGTFARTLADGCTIALAKGLQTGVRHRVSVCNCIGNGTHFAVKPVDQMPEAVLR